MDEEIWKPILGGGDYQVSNLGRAKNRHGHILEQKLSSGRMYVNLAQLGVSKGKAVHDLVAAAFSGAPSTSIRGVYHKNKDGTDNRAENIGWNDC